MVMETCSEVRAAGGLQLPSYTSGGKYGFSDKVIDGMTVKVNAVQITFKSPAFHASFQVIKIFYIKLNNNFFVNIILTKLS